MDKGRICRLCLAQPQISYSLLDKDGANILESLTAIKITEQDTLPTRACLKCWLNLKLAYQIRQNILEADKKLRLMEFEKDDVSESYVRTDLGSTNENGLSLELSEPSLETLEEVLDECGIKQEHFEMEHKQEPSSDSEDLESDNPDYGIKVENLTEDELLVICQTDVNEELLQEENNTNQSRNESNSNPTSCHICGSSVNEDNLIEHLKTHYSSRLKCDECNTYCENIASYRKHILSKHQDMQKYWMCKVCSASFQYKPLYKIHIEQAHINNNLQSRRPREVGKLFSIEDYKYDCPYCKRKFKTEERSLMHIKTHNKKECPICHVKITPANFKVHVDSHNSQPVVCHLCGVTYKNQTSLRSHIYYTHSTRKYTCKYCKKVFKKGYDLPLHIKKEHTGQKDHVCDICGKSFFTFHTLNNHNKMTHMKLRPFQCQYCQKKFSSKHSLTTHERQHTNITPYACDVCGEGFRQNVSLKAHRKSKHNIVEEKNCACKVCGKKFGTQWAVLSHMRIH